MKLITAILIILCCSIFSLAQQAGTVSGRVVQDSRGESAALIGLYSRKNKTTSYQTTADSEGNFRFENIPPGDYMITSGGSANSGRQVGVTATAYFSLAPGENQIVTLKLHTYPISETVTVSAGENQIVEQVSKTINVIGGQEMRDRADFALVESLRTIPGFRVQQLGGFGRTASIKTRGLRNQDTAILIDGIRFRDPAAITGDASPFLSDITLTSVSEVEVLRGSGSSLYGTNAIGGVVDFQTPDAPYGTHGQLSSTFGGMGLRRFRGNISKNDLLRILNVTGGASHTIYTKGVDGNDAAHNTNLQTRIRSNPFTNTYFGGGIFFSDANVRLNVNPDTFGTLPASTTTVIDAIPNINFKPDTDDPDSIQKSRFFSGRVSIMQILSDGVSYIKGNYHGLATRRRNDDGLLGPGFQSAFTNIFDGEIHTANAQITWSKGGVNTLTSAYEFELEKFGNEGSTPSGTENFTTRARQASNTFYVQDLVSLYDGRLQFAGGFRAQRFSLDRPEFSLTNVPYSNLTLNRPPTAYTFDGAASYFIRKSGTKFRAHVGNGYRVPSLYERFGTFFSSFGTPSFVALGDPFLKPEKTVAFDAGVEQNAIHDHVKLTATYFYTRLNDVIGFGNVVPNVGSTTRPFGGYVNQKGGHARGGEFSVRVKPKNRFDLFTSYTFTNSDQRTPQVAGSRNLKTLGVPDHQFTLVVTQRYKRAWVNFDFLATSSYLAPIFSNSTFQSYTYRFGGNRRGDLTAGYNFGFRQDKLNVRIYGTVENIFDHEYYESGFRTSGATARFGTTFSF